MPWRANVDVHIAVGYGTTGIILGMMVPPHLKPYPRWLHSLVWRIGLWNLDRKMQSVHQAGTDVLLSAELQFALSVKKLYSPDPVTQALAIAELSARGGSRSFDVFVQRLGHRPDLPDENRTVLLTKIRNLARAEN